MLIKIMEVSIIDKMERRWELLSYVNDIDKIKQALASVFSTGDAAIKKLERRIELLEKKLSEMQG